MSDYVLALSDQEIERYQSMAQGAEARERALWVAAGAVPGARIADVGSGPGAISVRLAAMAAPGGAVWAVDRDADGLAVASALADRSGMLVHTSMGFADATELPAGTFDLVMLRHVLAHNGGREQAIVDHLATLVRPGGVVYLADVDMDATDLGGSSPAYEEMMLIACGTLGQAVLATGSSWPVLIAGLVVTGFGAGLANPSVAGAALAAVPPVNAGMASGAVNTFRQLGYAFGVAVFGTVATTGMAHSLSAAPDPRAAAHALAVGGADALSRFIPSHELHAAFANGLDAAYVVAGGLGLLAAVLVFVLSPRGHGAAQASERAKAQFGHTAGAGTLIIEEVLPANTH
ncbi:methyltransferase domain-containing protein [Streptomyces sp. ID05-04B]|uniref:methyltransferase domain-containing protein n=1 Tax=Streptomyces sp. ID05-04B TaxID=3028661 RepID=UPI0029C26B64|nr:methyltransferase domain-containing protein [Streptomyces sp. ID05-04B]MDX5564987.1 methyltransferase domain-containing protein [Streptomyces sp. ID05-04B]